MEIASFIYPVEFHAIRCTNIILYLYFKNKTEYTYNFFIKNKIKSY